MNERAEKIRVLIADDQPIFRYGLRKLLETDPEIEVVGEAADGRESIDLARRLKPDILLIDLAMPGAPDMEALHELSSSSAPVRTLVLTAAVDRVEVVKALHLGARGVLLKQSPTELVFKCIHAVMAGQYWVGRDRVADLVESLRQPASSLAPEHQGPHFGLTARELEVVAVVVEGCSNREIADKCSISEKTVKHHLTNIFNKLGVSSRLELALFAVHRGLEAPVEPVPESLGAHPKPATNGHLKTGHHA